ncbi:DUF4142 domain-containing protein [Luteimonas sp. MC1895]|uniref:DUF4142 domain-containing protein n=1 Tax=Luteimonas sp. MC1895 TaxID=2819513 RepID=UPI0018F0C500|nr:DUF4142 domain-containing protein [Luteimonas sp. MC1895]MBJ6979392.1 DUF4142 domain-containing protein [Luteimonas sp. MC1895]
MLGRLIKFGVLAGAGYAAWKTMAKRPARVGSGFFEQALQSGVADVAAARSAQLRGASADVRAFAQQLEHDHGEHNSELAQASGLQLPEPDARQADALHALDQLQGEAYDRAWLQHMAKCHRDSIRAYEREVSQGGAGGPLAEDVLPKLRAHAERLAELQSTASGKGTSGTEASADAAGSTGGEEGAASTGGPRATI